MMAACTNLQAWYGKRGVFYTFQTALPSFSLIYTRNIAEIAL